MIHGKGIGRQYLPLTGSHEHSAVVRFLASATASPGRTAGTRDSLIWWEKMRIERTKADPATGYATILDRKQAGGNRGLAVERQV